MESELIPAVFPQLGLDGLVLLADLLDQALDERLPAGRTWRDQSHGWQRTLDGEREHDREQALTLALRDATVLLARSDQPGAAAVMDVLERRERAIFHRLVLHVLRHVPDQTLIEVAFHGEYREIIVNERLVRTEAFERLPDADAQAALLTTTFTENDGRTVLDMLIGTQGQG